MFLKVIVTIFCLFAFNLKSSISQNENNKIDLISIVAIVNDEPITIMDLNSRTQLIIASSNLPNNIETKRNLQGQIIQSLIQEKLQAQDKLLQANLLLGQYKNLGTPKKIRDQIKNYKDTPC